MDNTWAPEGTNWHTMHRTTLFIFGPHSDYCRSAAPPSLWAAYNHFYLQMWAYLKKSYGPDGFLLFPTQAREQDDGRLCVVKEEQVDSLEREQVL